MHGTAICDDARATRAISVYAEEAYTKNIVFEEVLVIGLYRSVFQVYLLCPVRTPSLLAKGRS